MLLTLSSRDIPILLVDRDGKLNRSIREYNRLHRWLHAHSQQSLDDFQSENVTVEEIESYTEAEIVVRSLIVNTGTYYDYERYVTYIFIPSSLWTNIPEFTSKLANMIPRSRETYTRTMEENGRYSGRVPLLYGLPGPLIAHTNIEDDDTELLRRASLLVKVYGRMTIHGSETTILLSLREEVPQYLALTDLDDLYLDVREELIPYDYVWYQGTDVITPGRAEYIHDMILSDQEPISHGGNAYRIVSNDNEHMILRTDTADVPDIERRRTDEALYSIVTAMLPLAWHRDARQELLDYLNDLSLEPPPEVREKYEAIIDQLDYMVAAVASLDYNKAIELIDRYSRGRWNEVRFLLA